MSAPDIFPVQRIWWCATSQRAVVVPDPERVLMYDVCSGGPPYCQNCGWFWLVPAPLPFVLNDD